MSAPALPPLTALASISTWSLSAVLCLPLLILYIGPQAFPRSHRSRFIASDSSLRYVHIRANLLFALALANFADAVNNIAHFTLAWQYGVYPVLVHRLIFAMTFSGIAPLSVMCLSYRCAVIVVTDPGQRTKFVQWTRVACLCAWALHASGVVYQAIAIVDTGNMPISVLLAERWVPLWATVGTGMIPFIAVGGSVWSLRMVSRRSATEPSTASKVTGASGDGSTRRKDSLALATTLTSTAASDPTDSARPSHLPHCGSTTTTVTTVSQYRPPTGGKPAQINYPLTQTFRVLTYGIFFTWIASSLLAVVPMIGPVRNNALLNLVMTTTIALESSFERLLKMHNRQRKGLRRQGVHAAAETGTRDGGGNSEIMVGESLLDVARSRADDQQNPQMNF